ncbi:MAG TPA: major facilitator superfamily domain-containing protein 6 [Anaerolineales bacterium]|nr:major facilitator superfamily domain-containing protein 6 [Anaerolineales bacterium]
MNPDNTTHARLKGDAINLRALYFGYFMALGALSPYISLYYQRGGLSGMEIGFLAALILVASSLAAIPWGIVADRFGLHRRILILGFLFAAAFIFLLSHTSDFRLMVPLVLGYAVFVAPIVPLLDSTAVGVAHGQGVSFGEIRVGGSVGWIISVWLVGILIQRMNIQWLFLAYVACMLLTLMYALLRPTQMGSVQMPQWDWDKLRSLLTERSVALFLASTFLVMVANGAVQNFFSLYMDGIGATESLIGVAWAVAAISEIPMMMYSGRLIGRIGSTGLLKLSFSVYAVRWLLFSFIHDPMWALALQMLHGLSFAAFLTAGVTYLNERTPAGLGTTAQSIFSVVSYGLAAFVGALAGGYLYDHGSMTVFFRVFGAVTIAGLLLFWVSSARPWRAAYETNA